MAVGISNLNIGRNTSFPTSTHKTNTYDNYNKAKSMAKEIADKTGLTASKKQTVSNIRAGMVDTPRPVTQTQEVSTPSYSGGGGGGTSDDIVNMIKNLLNEQKAKADEYYKTLYEQQIAKNKQDWESNRNQINRNFMRGNRYLNSLYGDVSGLGLSNRARNSQNWQSNLASARQNYTNNDATALSQYNSGLANNASTLAQGWYNYVLPVYTNRQQNEDDYAYRRYIANL